MSFERNVAFVVLHTVFFVYDISADTECLFSLSIDKKEITTANKLQELTPINRLLQSITITAIIAMIKVIITSCF